MLTLFTSRRSTALRLKSLTGWISPILQILGCSIVVGWWADIRWLQSFLFLDSPPPKPLTGFSFIAMGAVFSLFQRGRLRAVRFLLGLLFFIGLLSFLTFCFPRFFPQNSFYALSFTSSVAWMLMAVSLTLQTLPTPRWAQRGQLVACCVVILSSSILAGYGFHVPELWDWGPRWIMSGISALAFFLASVHILFLRDDTPFMGVVASSSPGGVMMRHMTARSLAGTLALLTAVILGERVKLYGPTFAAALVTVANIGVFLYSTLKSSSRINTADVGRRRAEAALRAGEEELRLLVEGVQDYAILLLNPEGRILRWNPGAEKIFGLTALEVLGRRWTQVFPDESVPNPEGAKDDGRSVDQRWHRRKNGELFYASSDTRPIFDEHGRLHGFVKVVQDITERKAAVERLRESEERLQLALEASHIGIWDWDMKDGQVAWTQYIFHLLGYRDAQVEPSYENFLERVHPDDRDAVRESFRLAMLRGEDYRCQFRVLWPDGRLFWMDAKGHAYLDESGAPRRMLGTMADVTSAKLMEEERSRAKEAAEAASRAKSTFLANMSHEIRTPMGVVMGAAELLKESSLSPAERDECIRSIRRNGEQLLRLIDDILDLSKVEAGKIELQKSVFAPLELVEEVGQAFAERLAQKATRLEIKKGATVPPLLRSDPVRVRQIVTNLLNNAVKFTEKGLITVELSFVPESSTTGRLEIAVRDTGIGIAPEHQVKLFQNFAQAEDSLVKKYGGTGLGLVLSRKVAQALGGDLILAESAPRAGSLFRAWIEVEVASEKNLQDHPAPKTPVSGAQLQGVRVLLVEDIPENQFIMRRFLQVAGARVDVASDGQEGVSMAMGRDYDVVLMDMQMPVKDGYQATRELRSLGYRKPILALTAFAMKQEQERSLAAGCDGHLTKPVDPGTLIDRVSRAALAERSLPTQMLH